MGIKSLESTFIYNHLNKANGLTQNIGGLLTNGTVLSEENLAEAMLTIRKNYKYPLKFTVLKAVEEGDIVLMYAPQRVKLPTCIPFVLTRKDGQIVAVVSVDMYGKMDNETGNVTIDPKKLYVMMEAAYMAKLCYMNAAQLGTRSAIITNGSAIYSMMFARVLNKRYALNIDKSKFHKVVMLASKFFMINLLGMKDSEMVFNYAIKNCPNGNLISLQEVNSMFPEENFTNIETFITGLAKPELGLNFKDLTVRNYFEAFINMYDASNLLSLESFPYFLYNVISVTDGAYINNQYIMEDIVSTYGAKLYVQICSLNN